MTEGEKDAHMDAKGDGKARRPPRNPTADVEDQSKSPSRTK
jgi:hypothetical protein